MGKLSTLIIGGAIGAAAALLYAPRRGEETRAMVSEKVNAIWGEAKDFTARAPQGVQAAYDSAQTRGESVFHGAAVKGQEFAQTAKVQATEFAHKATEKGQEAYNAVASRVQEAVSAGPEHPAVASDELREKIEAARQRIAAQVVKNAEESRPAPVEIQADAVSDVKPDDTRE